MLKKNVLFRPEAVEQMGTVYEILRYAKEHYPDRVAYRQIEGRAEETQITFGELAERVEALRLAFLRNGYAGKHIAIVGETSIQWITCYLAIISGVGVCVPIDRELPVETMVKQLEFADTDAVVCSVRCLKKLEKVLPLCPDVNDTVIMRGLELQPVQGSEKVKTLTQLIEEGREFLKEEDTEIAIVPDETCVIIFTSGTTGANKGVMLSNRNILGTLRGCARLLHYPETSYSVLPVNHSYELHAHLMSCLYCGTTVALNDDLKHILKNMERFQPEMSCMVPMMLELIVKKLKAGIKESGKEEQFRAAVARSNRLRRMGIDLRSRLFADLRKPLGGKLSMIICGGAALRQETIDFLDAIGIEIYNGYGITECSPVAAVNPSSSPRKNSVGYVLPTTHVRIANPDENGNGEIQFRGDNVMKGYYKAPKDTARVFTGDGWFRTGDIGHLDKDNYLYLSGRLKNLIILANGKNVFPEEVEESLQAHIPYIKECVVFADEAGTGIYAVCYLDRDFCREKGLTTPEEQKAYMQEDVRAFNKEMPGYKRITDYEITDKEFEKSSTHKIQRFKIKTHQGGNTNV